MSKRAELRSIAREVGKTTKDDEPKARPVHVSYLLPAEVQAALKRLAVRRQLETGKHISLSALAAEALETFLKSEGELK